jgi:DNA-binding transcriptional LysR family regulator
LGATLVDRQRGGLTDEGVLVVERARRVQRELDAIASDMASRGEEVAGEVRLGVIGTTARWLMPLLLTRLGRDHPLVRAVVAEGSTSALLPRLVSGGIDGAIVHLPVDDPELEVEPLFAEDLVLLVSARDPLAERDEVPLAALSDRPLLLPPPGTGLRRVIDRAASSAAVTLRPLAEIDGVRLLTSLALDGFGPTIAPATAVPGWIKGDFKRISVPELPRRVVGWANRRRPAPGAPVRATLEVLRELVATRGDRQPGVHVEAIAPLLNR